MLTTFLLICVNVFSQTPFDKGFREGYVDGYMYAAFENNDLNAIKPIPPIPPLPSIHESINSWRNGYDRGYIAGYKSYNSAGSSKILVLRGIRFFVPILNIMHQTWICLWL